MHSVSSGWGHSRCHHGARGCPFSQPSLSTGLGLVPSWLTLRSSHPPEGILRPIPVSGPQASGAAGSGQVLGDSRALVPAS